MIDFSNNPASVQIMIPAERILDPESINQFDVSDVIWQMSIKPGIRDVEKYSNGRTLMEGIEVFSVQVLSTPDYGGYSQLLNQIHKKILYPCVVFFEYQNKYKIAARKFITGSIQADKNILQASFVSSWIYEPAMSQKTKTCRDRIEKLLLDGTGNLKDLYDQICSNILNCPPQFIGSQKHLKNIVYDLVGESGESIIDLIDSTKKYVIQKKKSKYDKGVYGSTYTYFYEYEDIWAVFMNNDRIKKIIQNRRYRDIEDLIFSIDMKNADM